MNSSKSSITVPRKSLAASLVLIGALLLADRPALADFDNPHVIPPQAHFRGKTYPEWVVSFWQWALALPVEGHPFLGCPTDLAALQTGNGNVWYWSAPVGVDHNVQCDATIPTGTALFLPTLVVESSSLEAPPFGATSPTDQRAIVQNFANHIASVFVTIDGVPVRDLQPRYRFLTPQFHFTAPTPWIFGDDTHPGGNGTSTADGYYVMIPPLSPGKHSIHYGGLIHFDKDDPNNILSPGTEVNIPQDITINLTVGRKWGVDGPKNGTDAPVSRPLM